MSISHEGLLRPEPSRADIARRRNKLDKETAARVRVVSAILWLLAGVTWVLGIVSLGVGLDVAGVHVLGAALWAVALWAGLTSILILRSTG